MSSESLSPQIKALRRMGVAQRLVVTASLWNRAKAMKEATLRALHPEWSEDQVIQAAREALSRARR